MYRPGILVGGGAYQDREKIIARAEECKVPVFRTWNALDVVTDDSPVYGGTVGTYGGPGRNFGIQNCTWLMISGSRVSGRITGGSPETFAREAHQLHVDIETGELAGDSIEFVLPTDGWWLSQCREWVTKYDPVKPEYLTEWHPYGFMRRLSNDLPANAIVVYDTGGNAIMIGHCFQSKKGQRIFSSNGNTPMGFSMCGAIGAWFAQPERPIICIIGDGGMQLNIQELQTIVHYQIPIKIFILDNGILGNTKSYQRNNNKPEICCGPDGYSAPNFCAVARAYGVHAEFLGCWENYDWVVGRALGSEHAEVVDVWHPDFCTYEPRISRWDLPIEDMEPFLPRDEFRKNMLIEPWKGWENNK